MRACGAGAMPLQFKTNNMHSSRLASLHGMPSMREAMLRRNSLRWCGWENKALARMTRLSWVSESDSGIFKFPRTK